MIDKLKSQHTVHRLCQLLNVAMSSYLAHSNGKSPSPLQMEDRRLIVYIKASHARGRSIYGALKIQAELAVQGILVVLNRINRLRKLHDIRCIIKKKFRVTTDSKHRLSVAPNLLDRQFMLGESSLSTLKYSITASDDMQKSTTKLLLISQISFTLTI